MFENLLQMSTDTGHLELAAALSGLQRCLSQLPLSGTELLLIVPACDSCRHPHHMDTGLHSRQNWNCTCLPTVGNNLLQKFAETQREVKSHRATEQMQCIRHLPRQGTPHQGQLQETWESLEPGHWQHTLTNTRFSSQGWHFSTPKQLT